MNVYSPVSKIPLSAFRPRGFHTEVPPMPANWEKGFNGELKDGETPFIRLGQWFLHCKGDMVYSFKHDVFYTMEEYNRLFGA
jgi:hypothetical protein